MHSSSAFDGAPVLGETDGLEGRTVGWDDGVLGTTVGVADGYAVPLAIGGMQAENLLDHSF